MPVEEMTGIGIDFKLMAGQVEEVHRRMRKTPQPLLKDFGVAAQLQGPGPQLLALTNMFPVVGRVWEITDVGVYGADGHTPLTVTTAGSNVAPAVPGSTVAVQNPNSFPVTVVITGGTMSAVIINGITVGTGAGTYLLPSGAAISLTYTVAPTWTWTGPSTVTPVIADIYAGPTAGMEAPGDFASFIDSGNIPAAFLIGDHKAYAYANDRIYAWIYNLPNTPTQVTLAGTVRDWRIEDRSEVTI